MENEDIEIVTWTEIPQGLSAESADDCQPPAEQLGDLDMLSGNLVPGDLQLDDDDFSLPEAHEQHAADEDTLGAELIHADVLHAAADVQGSSLNVDEMTSAMASQACDEEASSDEQGYDFSDVDSGEICEFDELVGDAPQGEAESLIKTDASSDSKLAELLGESSSLAINEEGEE